jgi:putative addiction module component (TIGR02574 family)
MGVGLPWRGVSRSISSQVILLMDLQSILTAVDSWPVEERLRLLEEIWNRLIDQGYEPEVTGELKAELDRRLEALDKNPDAVVSWEVVEARALDRFRK